MPRGLEERVYNPASIEEIYRTIPGVGRKVRIQYYREYIGSANECLGIQRPIRRQGIVVQKTLAHFTVELIPERAPTGQPPAFSKKYRKLGRYKLSFLYVDVILGRVKIWEVGASD